MRTYLQTLGPSREGRFHITKPIEVMCLREDDGTVRASAHALGLLEDARAGSVEEALADLKAIIIDHIELLACKAPAEAVGYAGHVKERLREYVNFDELSHAAEASDAGRADQRGVPSSSPQHARNVGGDLKPESVKQEGRRSKKTGLATRLHGEMERGITPSLESARLAVSLACDVVQYDSRWSDSISFNRETRVAELDLIRAEISKLSTHMIRVPIWPPHELSLLHEACEQMQGHTFQQGELATVAEELRTVICRHMRAR
jgi:hypothetical protein